MTLSAGKRLGPYEILSPLGAGGMGEVYRAKDTKLGRDVAIKVLPESLSRDPERLARFEREARVLASLNHPHIASIYGMEESTDIKALVLELVEGPTLQDRIESGPMPVDEALPIARQIAEALEAAHEKGIIHRDLKPANVKLDPDGQGQGARLRPRESARPGVEHVFSRHHALADDVARDAGRNDPRHGRVHEPGAGARQDGGQARRHLELRRAFSTKC